MSRGPGPGWNEKETAHLLEMGEEEGGKRGHMFGHPALYNRGKLAVCAYGEGIGLKLAAERVAELLETGLGTPFQPYGKSPMREWVHVRVESPSHLDSLRDLVAESLAFVADPSAHPAP